jgi:hypothetical protein
VGTCEADRSLEHDLFQNTVSSANEASEPCPVLCPRRAGTIRVGVVYALVASESAHTPTILTVACLCVLFSALVGRWWTLALPLVLAGAVFALTSSEGYYERIPEDVQAAVWFGATYGLVLATAALLVRHYIEHRLGRGRKLRTE